MSVEQFFGADGMVWLVLKGFYVLLFLLYFIFTLIVWKQINLMVRTLNGSIDLPLRFMGMLISLIALAGVVMTLVIL